MRETKTGQRQVIVSGATGFVGQHLVPLLLDNNYQVIATARDSRKAKEFDWFKDVRFIESDFHKHDTQIPVELGAGLIHLAWQGLPNYRSLYHFEENLPSNYRFVRSLVLLGVRQVLVTGTCLEYGSQSGPIASDLEPKPNVPYAFAKDCLRQQLEFLTLDHSFCFQWARLFYLFGEGQNPNALLSQLDTAVYNKESIFNMSGGEQLRDYLPIKVAVRQLFDLYESGRAGIFNVCSGSPISVRRLVDWRIKELGSGIRPNLGFHPYADHEPMAFWGVRDIGETIFLPALPNAPLKSKQKMQALAPVRLRVNSALNFLENEAFDPTLIDYSKDYENSQAHSLKFTSHMSDVLTLLKQQLPKGSLLVEVGCGKGDFVEMVHADGYFNIRGFDAAYDGQSGLIEKRYLTGGDSIQADIVVLRHVLEHVARPYDFLLLLKSIFGSAVVYIEVPNYDWIISNSTFFDVTYEHVNYFSQRALKALFDRESTTHGLLFDDQYQYVISKISLLAPDFNCHYQSKNWKLISLNDIFPKMLPNLQRIDELAQGRSVFLWGAATKGCLFLAQCATHRLVLDKVKFAIDQNPQKLGKYLPGSLVPIKSKHAFFATAREGDLLLIANPAYKVEIEEEVKAAGLGKITIEML